MKDFIKNILISTAICVVIISIAGYFLQAQYLKFSAVFELLGINLLIHLLFYLLSEIDFKHWLIEIVLEFVCLNAIILVSRTLFHWNEFFSVALTILITTVIYIFAKLLDGIYIEKNSEDINEYIKINKIRRKNLHEEGL